MHGDHRDDHLEALRRPGPASASAAGVAVLSSFDGFHASHQRLLDSAARLARFQRAPLRAVVLHEIDRPAVMPVPERCARLVRAGAERVDVLELSAGNVDDAPAVVEMIKDRVGCASMVVACAAPNDIWTVPLAAALRLGGVQVTEVMRDVTPDRELVSSRLVASLIERGDVAGAADLLGRPYALEGEVVHGATLGRTIGFPTANLEADPARVMPARGVYAAVARLGDRAYRCAVNVGLRPTVATETELLIEGHLLDFDGDLYGSRLRIELIERIRDEQRFGSLDELKAQLARDVEATRATVAEPLLVAVR